LNLPWLQSLGLLREITGGAFCEANRAKALHNAKKAEKRMKKRAGFDRRANEAKLN